MNNYYQAALEKFGSVNLVRKNKQDSELIFNCCSCNRPKLYVSTETGLYHCFRCGFKGKLKHVKYRLKDLNKSSSQENYSSSDTVVLFPYTRRELIDVELAALISRGITLDDIRKYHICGGGVDGRIQIPNFVLGSLTDICCSWQYDKSKVNDFSPKYLNTLGADKSKILFNLHNIPENVSQIILCEGIFNAITAGENAVASFGCHLSRYQAKLLVDKKPRSILIAYDNDTPGVVGAMEAMRTIRGLDYIGSIYYVYLPQGKDVNDMGKENFKEYCTNHKYFIAPTNLGMSFPMIIHKEKLFRS